MQSILELFSHISDRIRRRVKDFKSAGVIHCTRRTPQQSKGQFIQNGHWAETRYGQGPDVSKLFGYQLNCNLDFSSSEDMLDLVNLVNVPKKQTEDFGLIHCGSRSGKPVEHSTLCVNSKPIQNGPRIFIECLLSAVCKCWSL